MFEGEGYLKQNSKAVVTQVGEVVHPLRQKVQRVWLSPVWNIQLTPRAPLQ